MGKVEQRSAWHAVSGGASPNIEPGQDQCVAILSNFSSTEEWWLRARKKAPKDLRRDFDTVVILVHWSLWKEHNDRIFQQVFSTASKVFELITEDI
jgi:hypothetical protein